MYYVYVIKSEINGRLYVGFSSELKQRIKDHNAGKSVYTANYRPWALVFYAVFSDEKIAKKFESYLKSHSGKAFMKKRLI